MILSWKHNIKTFNDVNMLTDKIIDNLFFFFPQIILR